MTESGVRVGFGSDLVKSSSVMSNMLDQCVNAGLDFNLLINLLLEIIS